MLNFNLGLQVRKDSDMSIGAFDWEWLLQLQELAKSHTEFSKLFLMSRNLPDETPGHHSKPAQIPLWPAWDVTRSAMSMPRMMTLIKE